MFCLWLQFLAVTIENIVKLQRFLEDSNFTPIFKILVRTLYTLSTIIYLMQSSENGSVKNPVSLSKNSFSASNFFMHIFNISARYLQSVEKIQWKL